MTKKCSGDIKNRDESLYPPYEVHGPNIPHFDREPLFVNGALTMEEKEVHCSQKRVDETWKETISKENKENQPELDKLGAVSFSSLVTSLGIQALMAMGELKAPGAEKVETDLVAAQETIDLLLILKEKTKGNLASEEEATLKSLIAELQMKFIQHKIPQP